MDTSRIALVQQTWASVARIGAPVAALFYYNLFAADRRLRPLLGGNLDDHGSRLLGLIDTAVANLGEPARLEPTLQETGRRHAALGLEENHYIHVGLALLKTLEQSLGDAFSPEVERAWVDAYEGIAARIVEAAKECASALGGAPVANVA
jgi:hemoglobin-like flavoprotein